MSDQVPLRESWIKLNTAVKKVSGKREINGVYLSHDKYYIQKFTEESFSNTSMVSIFSMIDSFAKENKDSFNTSVMLVPSPGVILDKKLPYDAPFYDYDKVYNAADEIISAPLIDLRKPLKDAASSNVDLYYHTDHHWQYSGAQIAYNEFIKSKGLTPKSFEDKKVCDNFYGTTYSKLLDTTAKSDSIFAPKLPSDIEKQIYRPEKLEAKDKYEYFFGGNFDKVSVDTNVKNGKNILLIKDSFANSFAPFLTKDYEKIVLVDLRFFDGDLRELCKEEEITDVLFLYETSNLLTDKGILKLANSIETF